MTTGGSMPPRGHSLWHDVLTSEDRSALDPGVPHELGAHPDVLVVGGGIVGVATALACRQAGLGRVLLLERGRLGSGATGGAAGLLVPEADHGRGLGWFVELCRHSLASWQELHASWPGGIGLVDEEVLFLGPPLDWLLPYMPEGAESLTEAEVARVAPALSRPVPGVMIRGRARVNPLLAVARLSRGIGRVASQVEVTRATVAGDRVVSVSTTVGPVSPGAVVFATGMPPAIPGLGLALPAFEVKGHLLVTGAAHLGLPVILGPSFAMEVDGGRVLAGGTLDPEDRSPDPDARVLEGVAAELEAAVPAAGGGAEYAWCCFRPAHADYLPVIDQVPGVANAWVTSGHYRTGILMAPESGRLLAKWISSGVEPDEAAPLGISRLAAS